ncbi:hypothetical protein N7539_006564 [Penicillium diatomitis]|uniref:GPI anchored protein n=1 Tax=Penicillium diatomitis TaxID=2819901 RepID=A0A9W9X1S7_9EURO|nr:uncharacterized protein N7539_006564 [Penicillium diatomitis]KAJ5480670.1 hypothetical protein N7539_006564 [Penicillium diatomitis]
MKGFIGGIPIALLAIAAQAMEHGPGDANGDVAPLGATVIGGPSGNDADGGFDFGVNVQTKTNVDEYSKDDHSIKVKETDIHLPPHGHGAPMFAPGAGPFHERRSPQFGNTVIGGPSGDDEGQIFDMSMIANIQTSVDEYSKDDHSIKVKETDVHPPPVFHAPGPYGGPGAHGGPGPQGNGFDKRQAPEVGGTVIGGPGSNAAPWKHGSTVIGGPSGDDAGQTFSRPINVDVATSIKEHYEDDHSVDIDQKNVFLPPHFPAHGGHGPAVTHGGPFRRAYSPDRAVGGATAIGGPSGDDQGSNFFNPTSVGVDTDVKEHHEDNHAVNVDSTTVTPPQNDVPHMPWMPYKDNTPISHPGPIAADNQSGQAPQGPMTESEEPSSVDPTRQDGPQSEDASECMPQTHEVVHTVTKTEYKDVQSTVTVYATPVESHAMQMPTATPSSHAAQPPVDQKNSYHPSSAAPSSSYDYPYPSQSSASSPASYSMIPVDVPAASSSHAPAAYATPSGSYAVPSGADALRHPSGRPSGSATPSAYMFEGSAARISGGFASAVAAVVGVLAFVL